MNERTNEQEREARQPGASACVLSTVFGRKKRFLYSTVAISMTGSKLFLSLLLPLPSGILREHVHLIHRHFLRAHYGPGAPLGANDRSVNRTERTLHLEAARIRRRLHVHQVCSPRSVGVVSCLRTRPQPLPITWARQPPATPRAITWNTCPSTSA